MAIVFGGADRFFTGEAQLFHVPPDGRHTGGRGEGHLQLCEGAVRVLLDQRRERVQLGGEHRMPPVLLLARGDVAGLAAPLFEPPDPGGTDLVCDRDGSRLHAGIAIAEDAFEKIRIGAHWSSCVDVPRRRTMNRLSSTRALRKTR